MDIKFTKNEAHALHNITKILIGYMNGKYDTIETKEEAATAKILVDIHQALASGERKFGFSQSSSDFLIDLIQFWYNGVAIAVIESNRIQGPAREMFIKHYNLVPSIIKKLSK